MAFWLEIGYSHALLGSSGGIFPSSDVIYHPNTKKVRPCMEALFEPLNVEVGPVVGYRVACHLTNDKITKSRRSFYQQ